MSKKLSFHKMMQGMGEQVKEIVSQPKQRSLMAERIQRRRSKGWKIPPGAVYVGRPTKWGNPFVVGTPSHDDPPQPLTAEEAVTLYEDQIDEILDMADASLDELRGKDLVCWCPLNQPCHADVLIRLANKVLQPTENHGG